MVLMLPFKTHVYYHSLFNMLTKLKSKFHICKTLTEWIYCWSQ